MRFWKAVMAVLCLGIFLPVLFGTAESKAGKGMVQDKTAYVTRCKYYGE